MLLLPVLWPLQAKRFMSDSHGHARAIAAAPHLLIVTRMSVALSDAARAPRSTSAEAWLPWDLGKKEKNGAAIEAIAMIATTGDVNGGSRDMTSIPTRMQTAIMKAGIRGMAEVREK